MSDGAGLTDAHEKEGATVRVRRFIEHPSVSPEAIREHPMTFSARISRTLVEPAPGHLPADARILAKSMRDPHRSKSA